MLRMVTMAIACFAVAVVGVVTLDGRVARAEWNEYGSDWDEAAPMGKTLGHEDTSLGDQFFHVEWAATPGPAGEAELTGYVYNDDGEAAARVDEQHAPRSSQDVADRGLGVSAHIAESCSIVDAVRERLPTPA